jgi:hypothetical protein
MGRSAGRARRAAGGHEHSPSPACAAARRSATTSNRLTSLIAEAPGFAGLVGVGGARIRQCALRLGVAARLRSCQLTGVGPSRNGSPPFGRNRRALPWASHELHDDAPPRGRAAGQLSVNQPLSFEHHVKGLFRRKDRQSMLRHFDLWSFGDVSAHADAILGIVRAGRMPCDGAWPRESVDIFQQWADGGKAP